MSAESGETDDTGRTSNPALPPPSSLSDPSLTRPRSPLHRKQPARQRLPAGPVPPVPGSLLGRPAGRAASRRMHRGHLRRWRRLGRHGRPRERERERKRDSKRRRTACTPSAQARRSRHIHQLRSHHGHHPHLRYGRPLAQPLSRLELPPSPLAKHAFLGARSAA